MKEWFIRAILLAVLVALGFWGWQVFFPSPEKVIRKRLGELAKAASFSSKEGLLAEAWNASVLGEFFTPDVQVTVDVPGTQHTINGRDELLQAAAGARSAVSSVTIEFPDIKIVVSPDQDSAVVNLTAKGKVAGQSDFYLQELRLHLIRIKRDWLINQIETVKTLSLNDRDPCQLEVHLALEAVHLRHLHLHFVAQLEHAPRAPAQKLAARRVKLIKVVA